LRLTTTRQVTKAADNIGLASQPKIYVGWPPALPAGRQACCIKFEITLIYTAVVKP